MICSQKCFCGLKSPALISSYDPNRLKAGGVRMTLARHMPYAQSSEKIAEVHTERRGGIEKKVSECFGVFFLLLLICCYFRDLCSSF